MKPSRALAFEVARDQEAHRKAENEIRPLGEPRLRLPLGRIFNACALGNEQRILCMSLFIVSDSHLFAFRRSIG